MLPMKIDELKVIYLLARFFIYPQLNFAVSSLAQLPNQIKSFVMVVVVDDDEVVVVL